MSSTITILYRPDLNEITGSPMATILLCQAWHRWCAGGRSSFYKFMQPAPQNSLYVPGDSWTEELGFSLSQLRTAIKKIAQKITLSNPEKDPTKLLYYWADSGRLIHWECNEKACISAGLIMLGVDYDHNAEAEEVGIVFEATNQIQPKRPRRSTFIYMMKDNHTGCIKIGRSNQPSAREKTLQSEKPSIEMIGYWQGTKEDEVRLHKMYAHKRVRGEWFRLSKADVRVVRTYCKTMKPQLDE